MLLTRQDQLSEILELLSQNLSVPEEIQRDARYKYEHLAAWMKKDSEEKYNADSSIYPQGSARLGTLVLPIRPEDEHDVDLVFCREIRRGSTTQEKLKNEIGEQLSRYQQSLINGYATDIPTVEPGRRCWTLKYKGKFHMDLLPAIPDDGHDQDRAISCHDDDLLITDQSLMRWQNTSPKAYADWFDKRQATRLTENLAKYAKRSEVSVEHLPTELVPTPLREAIKLLKRHRDIKYAGKPGDKPISIIITTLATRAYNNQANVADALLHIIKEMPLLIEDRDGEKWVQNPVNPEENFADKWKQYPSRQRVFIDWLQQLREEFDQATQAQGIDRLAECLKYSFGDSVVERTIEHYGNRFKNLSSTNALYFAPSSGAISPTPSSKEKVVQVQRHTFYGA